MERGADIRQQIGRENAANKRVPLSVQERHLRELDEVLRGVILGTMHPFAMSALAQKGIEQGLPCNPEILFAPARVLELEARNIALLRPRLASLHGDCRAYLAVKQKRRPQDIEGSAAWNLLLGGTPMNPSGV